MGIELHGFKYSVYTWIVRFALFEKGVDYGTVEVNPFSEVGHPAHPFGKVPLLIHDGFRIYETSAITRYIDCALPGPSLQPGNCQERARSDQIINVIDCYAYWPLVRQVSSHGYFRKVFDLEPDPSELQAGLNAAPKALAALNDLAAEQRIFKTGELSLSDIHLGPMISYFEMAPEGSILLKSYSALHRWWEVVSTHQGLLKTKPELPLLNSTSKSV